MDPSIQQFLLKLPAHKMELASIVRDIIMSSGVKLSEKIKWNQLCFVAGKQNIAFIYTFPGVNYINLGFFNATALSDPQQLFEGTGKGMRHIKIWDAESIPAAQIKNWLKEAVLT